MSALYDARILSVDEGSPVDDAGIAAGMSVRTVDGHALMDYIDWLWWSAGDVIEVTGCDLDGDCFDVELSREPGQGWGITFADPLFDGMRLCVNACRFCFMRMLPAGMRRSLYLRDDDYRLSWLQGNFVTLTNITDEDVARIVEMRIEPIHVSLHAVTPEVRESLMGKNQQRGIDVLETLLAEGLHVHAQIVLCPGVNDGAELQRTLDYIEDREGILSVGIVPLGYTRFQHEFSRSYEEPSCARAIIEAVRPYQERSRARRGSTRFQLGDEFYCRAYPHDTACHMPPCSDYDDFAQYYDGIGVLSTFVEEWRRLVADTGRSHIGEQPVNGCTLLVCGTAFADFLIPLLDEAGVRGRIAIVGVANRFFGGNVDVSGLLTARDVEEAVVRECEHAVYRRVMLPDLMFNEDGLTLDDVLQGQMAADIGVPVVIAPGTAEMIWKELS